VIKGRARLKPRGDAHLSAIALMVLISKAQGQSLETEALEAFIPTTFVRPSFEVPVRDTISAGTISSGDSGEHEANRKLVEMEHHYVTITEALRKFDALAISSCSY